MVRKENPVYLFVGQDSFSKDAALKKLKSELFSCAGMQHFNLDVLYGRELSLKGLQEKLLNLPLKAKKRIVVIKEGQDLKEDIKEFIIKYVKKPNEKIALVLDINKFSGHDDFIRQISRYAPITRFKEDVRLDAFALGRAIDFRKRGYALWVLSRLLRSGEKPERILGGLRYGWEKSAVNTLEARKKTSLLLNCDIDIKTGRLRPDFALERLVVNLCGLAKPSG